MAEYSKKKNDELAALCKERGLPHTGKKADLVKRLEDDDLKPQVAALPTETAAKPAVEDEIDWDDEPAATSEATKDVIAAGGIGEVANPAAVPNQKIVEDPAITDDLTVVAPATETAGTETPAEPKKEEKDFSTGLAERTIDEEIEKRKARARKFGTSEDTDEIKMLERARRFGTTDISLVPGMLNKALPEGREKKRGREGESDGGIRKMSRGPADRARPTVGKRQQSDRPKKDAPAPAAKKEKGSGPSWMNAQDREKAEARKAKFATTTA